MELAILIPALLVFLYSLYRLVKDDYVFIRKGILLEQSYDIAFIILWISLFFSRAFFLLFNYQPGKNIFFQFFSINEGGFSLLGAIIGGMIAMYFIGRYKKVPLGRLSDFLSLSFLFALPVGFLTSALLVNRSELLFTLLSAVLYFLLILFFVQFLYPRILSRTLKEGMLSILFLLFFSLISLLTTFLVSLKNIAAYVNSHTITLFILLIFSLILLFKEAKPFSQHRRTLHR